MPGKRHSEEQIVYALQQIEAGKKVSEVCREMGCRTRRFTAGSGDTPDWDCTSCGSSGNCGKRTAS